MDNKREPAEFVGAIMLHVTGGKEYYTVWGPNAKKRSGTYEMGADYWYECETHKRDITCATRKIFEQAHANFYRTVKRANGGLDGYTVVSAEGCRVAYKRLPNSKKWYAYIGPKYSFVLSCQNYTRIFFSVSVYDFFKNFILPSDTRQQEKIRLQKMHELFMNPKTNGGDCYLACAFKECCGKMTRGDADFLCADDMTYRFVPEDKVYDADDIEILEVENGEYTFFSCRSVNFVLKVDIGGREYKAFWRPSDQKYAVLRCYPPFLIAGDADPNKLTICSKMFYRQIAISDALKNAIDVFAERRFREAYLP